MSIYQIEAVTIDGVTLSLGAYRGRVLLVVNVASRCGYTPQYAGLETLFRVHGAQGLTVLGFPCNQFGSQEPGAEADIKRFCSTNYDVTFPLFAKVDVNGSDAHPLYRHLKREAPGVFGSTAIKWNFTKFLVGPDGAVVGRFAPHTTPEAMGRHIRSML